MDPDVTGCELNGILIQQWDDATATYTERDTTGAVTLTRPYNADETAAAAIRAAAAQAAVDRAALHAAVRQIITDLQAEKDRAQIVLDATAADINAAPATYIVDAAKAAKRIADAAIDLARFVKDMP